MMHDNLEKILITEEEILKRNFELAQQINEDYKGQKITFIGLLNGSVPTLAGVIKHIVNDCEIDFMDVSSYGGTNTESTGEVCIRKDLNNVIKNKNVIIIEDIIDTGNTLKVVKEMLEHRSPKSLKILTLLDKPSRRVNEIKADYIGFVVPDEFVVGYGLDYNELYRNLPYIGVLKEDQYS